MGPQKKYELQISNDIVTKIVKNYFYSSINILLYFTISMCTYEN